MKNLREGQVVYVVPRNYRDQEGEPEEQTITKVGRKYFEVEEGYRKKQFEIETGIEKGDSNYRSRAYATLQEILDQRERGSLSETIRRAISHQYGNLPYTLDQLRRIVSIMNEPKQTHENNKTK